MTAASPTSAAHLTGTASPRPARASHDVWEDSWKPQLGQPPVDLEASTLENYIDALKLEFLSERLPTRGRVLEVGCGSGRLLARVGRVTRGELVALDPSPSALSLATLTGRRYGLEPRRVRGDARALPFGSASFDLVLSGGLLEHFADPRPVLHEMVRVLKPGGTFYADVVPRRLSLYRLRELPRMLHSSWLLPGVYESTFGPGFYRRALAELGCDGIATRSAGVYPPRARPEWARRARSLDGTPLADLLGWYFMIAARRAAPSP